MMKEDKKASEYVYEDEQVYLNDNNELFLKEGPSGEEKKLADVSAEEVEEKISELEESFDKLRNRLEEVAGSEDVTLETLSALKEEILNASAIGDLGGLVDRIEEMEATFEENGVQEVAEDETEEQAEAETDESDEENSAAEREDAIDYYRDIVKKAQDLAQQSDWNYVQVELDNLSHKWSEGPDSDSDEVKKLFKKFNQAVDSFEERKEEHYKQQKQQKEENLETRKNLLEEFEGIIANKTWTATKRVSQMKRQWGNTGALPGGKGEKMDERFQELLEIFNEHKVDRLVQERQKEEDNLMLKLTILEKMENVANSIDHETMNWKELHNQFEDLTKQWKKVGRVPKDKANGVWERYKNAQDLYYDNKYRYDPDHQSKVDRFRHKKEKIIEEAEELVEQKDIAKAARKINKLHRRWKKVGNLPQRAEDELWNRFKSATDAFNERKANNRDKIEKQEEEHYNQKLELIDKANAVKDTDDFEKGHSKMQSFMDRWKKIGPVPRGKSEEIWKQFKGAMDEFYDRRREHFKEVKEERKENLEKKEEILDKLRELGQHEDPIEAVDIAKDLQEKFKNIGYVPIKQKNRMWKEYRKACDVIYDRMRAAKSGDEFDQELAKADLAPDERSKIQELRKEFKKAKKEVRELEKKVLQYKEKKTYFKPSKGGNALLDQVEDKIEEVEQKIEAKEQKMDDLTEQMEEIREDSDT